MIDKDDLRKSCFQLNLNLDDELLDSLFDYCDLDKDGLISYLEFANFLNWKDKMAVKEFEEKIITEGRWVNTGKLWMMLFLQQLLKGPCWSRVGASLEEQDVESPFLPASGSRRWENLRYKCISEPRSSVAFGESKNFKESL